MKYLCILCFLALFFSCDDGDLQIETINFDSVTISTCESDITTASTVFFKMNNKEALILTLKSGLLKNEASTTQIVSQVPNASKVTFRTFSDNVTQNYFCDDIPTTTPSVIEEIEASGGEIWINTTMVTDGTTTSFQHQIELSEITFITAQDERITDLQVSDFGIITTTP